MRRILLMVLVALGALVLAAAGALARRPASPRAIHFAGLETAVQCFPGAMHPGERRPVYLSWHAASPSGRYVYEIFMARVSGHENFAQPTWSVRGTLRLTTPKLPPGRYFVVRARAKSGQEDHNDVERQAVNPCV